MDDPAPVSEAPRSSRLLPAVLLGAIVVALVVVGYLVLVMRAPVMGPLGTYWSALTLPGELREAYLVSSSARGSVVYTHAGYTYGTAAGFPDAIHSLAKTVKAYAALESVPGFGMRRVVVDGEVVRESASVRSFAASPDGRRIAYAETADGAPYSSDPADWVVKVFYPDPGLTQEIGVGFAPFFLDNDTLVRFTAAGIYAVNLETGVPVALRSEPFTHVIENAYVAPDRMHVAWQDAKGDIHVYGLEDNALTSIGTVSFKDVGEGTGRIALGNDALYTVLPTDVGSEVWRLRFDGSRSRIAVFPPELRITQLVFMTP